MKYRGYPKEFDNELRERIRQRDKDTCQLCGELQTSRNLDVHHINKDKYNNDFSNLITLCSRCHSKVHVKKYYKRKLILKLKKKDKNFYPVAPVTPKIKPITPKIKPINLVDVYMDFTSRVFRVQNIYF